MKIAITHETLYRYSEPVRLAPHLIRLRPRLGGELVETAFDLSCEPAPVDRRDLLDAAGNRITRLWFEDTTRHLRLLTRLAVETGRPHAYMPRLEPGQAGLPVAYGAQDTALLTPYLRPRSTAAAVAALAEGLLGHAGGDLVTYLNGLTDWIYREIRREIRPTGGPRTPARTLACRSGACRDQTVLFLALCRAVGLAGRFVSGYQDRSAMETDRRYLHAWPEVYLPGAGWYGYDPTRGIAAADGHVPLAASHDPAGTMPVEGSYFGRATSEMDFSLTIDVCG